MADNLHIQNPSITSGTLASMFAFSAGTDIITAISGHPVGGIGGGGGGTPTEGYWRPIYNDNTGDLSWLWSIESTANTPTPANIKGPSGASGAKGEDGENGTSVVVKSIREFNDVVGTHTKGGTEITLEWNEGQTVKTSAFSAFNGEKGQDGAGASYTFDANTLSGDGETTDIGVNTNVIATQAWVGDQNYLTAVNTTGSVTGNGDSSPIGLATSAEQALAAVGGKFDKPVGKTSGTYALEVSEDGLSFDWEPFPIDKFVYGEDLDTYIFPEAGLSARFDNVKCEMHFGIDTNNMSSARHYGFTTNGWSEIDGWMLNRFQFENGISGVPDMSNYIMHVGLSGDYLPTSGGIVSGSTYFSAANGQNMLAVASAATLIGASRQTSEHFGQDTTALGTTWIGVGGAGMYRGFLKYTQGGNVGDLDSNNTMQVEFTPNNKGTIFAKAKNSGNDCPETQILNPTKASCDAMTQSANANLVSGPNYMLAKNADGQFVIGAACINCTAINDVTLAPNTYYFVYEV